MKKMIMSLVLTVACMGLGVAFADDQNVGQSKKDECLLISKDCKNSALSLQEKIEKLNSEIKKGKRVYTPEELKKLNEKLLDAEDTLDQLLKY